MPVDPSLVGREFPPTPAHDVTADSVRDFAAAVGAPEADGAVPATYPIVVAFAAMQGFLDDVGVELSRIIHGDQRFSYRRPVRVGDRLTAQLAVSGLRQISGNDLIATTSQITDADGELVCTTTATLVHRGQA